MAKELFNLFNSNDIDVMKSEKLILLWKKFI